MESNLSKAESDLLAFISMFYFETGFMPSHRDCEAFGGVGSSATQDLLASLKERGLVKWVPQMPRTLHLTGHGHAMAGVIQNMRGDDLDYRVKKVASKYE